VNLKAFRQTLLSRRTLRRWVVAFLAGLGFLAGVAGLLAALFPDAAKKQAGWYLWVVIGVPVVWGVLVALPRRHYSRRFSHPDMEISIVVGDLFEQDGHVIIGMSDTFDTETPVIIQRRGIQGQLLTRVYGDDLPKLDQDLQKALRGSTVVATETIANKPAGKRDRYAVGTVAVLGDVDRHFFCVAYTRMGNNNVAQGSVSDLWQSLCAAWEAVRNNGQGDPVSIPVVGSGLARLSSQISRPDLVRLILLSFLTASRAQVVTSHLRIVIHPNDAENMDLRELADFLEAQ
jgi:hypothetical protein